MLLRLTILLSLSTLFVGCASGTFKARQEQREKMAANTGMYCEFISGDLFPDVDVELSMSMARRCDANKNFSIANYKNSSDHNGIIYCCSTMTGRRPAPVSAKKTSGTSSTNPSSTSPTPSSPSSEAEVIPEQ